MPKVLLITEQQRLLRLFSELERKGLFRLRLSPTLAQAEEEIAAGLPQIVFVEDQLSQLSAATIAAFLHNLLPEGSRLVLMGSGWADTHAEQIQGVCRLDLTGNDEALQRAVRELVPEQPKEEDAAPPNPPPAPPPTARELLFGESDRAAAGNRRMVWLIPLAMLAASLAVVALYPRGSSTTQAPPAPSGTASAVPSATQPQHPVPGSLPAAGQPSAAAPVRVSPPSATATPPGPHYATHTVRPGERLLRILMKDYGYPYREALAVFPEVRRLNKRPDLNKLQPGEKLIIPLLEPAESPGPDKRGPR